MQLVFREKICKDAGHDGPSCKRIIRLWRCCECKKYATQCLFGGKITELTSKWPQKRSFRICEIHLLDVKSFFFVSRERNRGYLFFLPRFFYKFLIFNAALIIYSPFLSNFPLLLSAYFLMNQ